MATVEKLVAAEFAERFGQTPKPDPSSFGNYECCDTCRQTCEAVADSDLKHPDGALGLESRMGVEAFVYALPQLAKAALKNKRDNFEVLAKLNYRYFPQLDLSQREALRWLLEFCRSSEFGRRDEQARITENLFFLEKLGDRADYPPPIGTEQDAAEQPATAGESK